MAVEGNRMDVIYHEIGDQRISYYRCLPEINRPEDAEEPADTGTPELVTPGSGPATER